MGRIHMEKQDFNQLQTRKLKALKRQRLPTANDDNNNNNSSSNKAKKNENK